MFTKTVGLIVSALALTTMVHAAPPQDKLVMGETLEVGDATLATWARVNGAGKVTWVGVTIPLALAEANLAGGSVAVLAFPAVVQETTYFNHFQLHAEPEGHPGMMGFTNPERYFVPHFDFHFYAVEPAEVEAIPFALPPLPEVSGDRLPRGYAQPDISVPMMGRHSGLLSEFSETGPLDATMIAGFLPDGSVMHFIEPMVSYEYLLERKNFSLRVPQPKTLGWQTSYPTQMIATYDAELDAFHFVFKGFHQSR